MFSGRAQGVLTGELVQRLRADGFAMSRYRLPRVTIARYCDAVETMAPVAGVRTRGETYAARDLFEAAPAIREMASLPLIRNLVEQILGPQAFVVRAVLFDKRPTANWKVAWHQDLTILVRERHESAGFGPWSIKAGIPHVQPPISVMEQLLTVRVHLDACDARSGALRVLPASHRSGKLTAEEIHKRTGSESAFTCTAAVGGVMIMRPLLLHASSAALVPRRRRVVHFDFAAMELPYPLTWHTRAPLYEPVVETSSAVRRD
jgi:hypothetical protein